MSGLKAYGAAVGLTLLVAVPIVFFVAWLLVDAMGVPEDAASLIDFILGIVIGIGGSTILFHRFYDPYA
jgi:hypothetical protein